MVNMRRSCSASVAAAAAATASTNVTSLSDICSVSVIQAALPSVYGITLDSSSVTANAMYNYTDSGSTYNFCNVTVSYSHTGKDDKVTLYYFLPAPSAFKGRYVESGGMAYAITKGASDMVLHLPFGAVAGTTDGGFGSLSTSLDSIFLSGNGSYNYDPVYMFGYKGHGESTTVGKALTANVYGADKVYTYFRGCSDGGREAWSQVQRWGEIYDGVVAGAPAFRYGQQQVNHLTSNVIEHTLDYYPPPCELEMIMNLTIAACDPLDGKTDGVIARSDLCMLNFNLNSTIGEYYSCAAQSYTGIGLGYSKSKRQSGSSSDQPAQNGTISEKGVAVAQAIIDGLHSTTGDRAYLSYQIGAQFTDAETQYDSTTDSWVLDIAGTGGEWVAMFLELIDTSNLSTLDNVTYDTLISWMNEGMVRYMDSLQTTLPDLTTFQTTGGKVLHYHGEQDPSVPAASSVHYWNSVRNIMYPGLSFNESVSEMSDWYRLFLVPGAAHCGANSYQADGPFPDTTQLIDTIISWVEEDSVPTRLNATIGGGDQEGEIDQLCTWPLRPLYSGNSTSPSCAFDQASYDTWIYDFPAFKVPVY